VPSARAHPFADYYFYSIKAPLLPQAYHRLEAPQRGNWRPKSSTRHTTCDRRAKEAPMEKNPISIVLGASAFAAHKHRDQRRKGAEASPYINHPIAVANVLANEAYVTDPVILAAALLHDTIEDTDTTADELTSEFGAGIAEIVLEVTDDKSLPKQERKRLQIEHAAALSEKAKLVKLADKICNLRDMNQSPPVDWSTERKAEYFAWAKQVVDPMRGVSPTLEALFDAAFAHGRSASR
jgi:GTP diphosphokinase / guanosine-3',5'-bis(diphosphate) 3'-diphosphatase